MSEPQPAVPVSGASALDDVLVQLTLTIQCLHDAVPAAPADDPVYRTFLTPPDHSEPLDWASIQYALQSISGQLPHAEPDLKGGLFGLQSLVPFLQQARRHPAWASSDEQLAPMVGSILRCVIERCTRPRAEITAEAPIVVPEFKTQPHADLPILHPAHVPSFESTPAPTPSNVAGPPAMCTPATQNGELIDIAQLQTPPSTVSSSRKRNSTTVAHKIQVIEHHNREGATQKQTAKRFGLTQSQLSRWLKEEDELREYVMDKGSSSKRQRTGDFPQIEETLLRYFIEAKSRNIAPSDDNLKDRTKAFMKLYQVPSDALKVSNGWLLRFKGRNNIKSYVRPAPPLFIESRIVTIREQLRMVTDGFALRDIYAADEVGLYCNLSPLTGPLCVNPAERAKLTYLLCSNADGSDKRAPLAIGSSQDPTAYKDAIGDQAHAYRYTTRGWMTGPVFAEWLKKFDREMTKQQRHVLLLIDNSPAHVYDADSLLHTRVHFLPSNNIPQTQPFSAGIVHTFKSNYRRNLIESFIASLALVPTSEHLSVNAEQVKAMTCAQRAWDELTPQTIHNSFTHTGIISDRHSDGLTVIEHQAPVPSFALQHVSDLDMEKSLMATQSALITLQREPRLIGSLLDFSMSIEALIDLEGEQDRTGWERMPSDEDLVKESVFLSSQLIEENKHRKREDKSSPPNGTSSNNRKSTSKPVGSSLKNHQQLTTTSTGSAVIQLKPVGSLTNTSNGLHMVPMSVQETIQSFEQIEYSLPFYVNESVVEPHLHHLQMLKLELRKALTGPGA